MDLNAEVFGRSYLGRSSWRRAVRDLRSFLFLARHFRIKEFYNFSYARTLVPTGEGSQRWLYSILPLLDRLIRTYPERIPVPRFFEMETTTLCNKRCFICEYVHWPDGDQIKRHMSIDEFRHVVDQFPVIRWANLTGEGSSFLNPDYFAMLRYLWEKHRTSIWLVDHLSDISFQTLKTKVLPYIHGIYVSMDGATKQTYEFVKSGCRFDTVLHNLKSIIGLKRTGQPFPHLAFRYVLLKENAHESPLFLDLLNSIARPHEWGGSSSMVEFTGLLYFPEIHSHYVSQIPSAVVRELMKRKGGIEFRFVHAEEERNPPIECCHAWMEPYIMMPGYILPCCSVLMSNRRPFLRKYAFGNVFEKDFPKIWTSDYYSLFRKMVVDAGAPVPRICVGCRGYRTEHRVRQYGVWDIHEKRGSAS